MTLQAILDARDARRRRQEEFFRLTPGATLVVATVVAPGSEKRSREADTAAAAMGKALAGVFADTALWHERWLPTGFELWISTDLTREEAKRRAVEIEETHPLGRLFDIDVIGSDLRPASRTEFGLPERHCILCDRPARYCMRAGTHTYREILNHIRQITDDYLATL